MHINHKCSRNLGEPEPLDLQPLRPVRLLRLVEPDTARSSVQRVDVLDGLIHEYRRGA